MNLSNHTRSRRAVILVATVYCVTGITLAALAGMSTSSQMRVAWRLTAWVISAAAFLAHIAYEHVRLRNAPLATALHTTAAVAMGALALAAAANVHALWVGTGNRSLLVVSLVAWPAVTAVPAFVVALAAAAALRATRRRV